MGHTAHPEKTEIRLFWICGFLRVFAGVLRVFCGFFAGNLGSFFLILDDLDVPCAIF